MQLGSSVVMPVMQALAAALIRPLAQEHPSVALERKKRKEKKERKKLISLLLSLHQPLIILLCHSFFKLGFSIKFISRTASLEPPVATIRWNFRTLLDPYCIDSFHSKTFEIKLSPSLVFCESVSCLLLRSLLRSLSFSFLLLLPAPYVSRVRLDHRPSFYWKIQQTTKTSTFAPSPGDHPPNIYVGGPLDIYIYWGISGYIYIFSLFQGHTQVAHGSSQTRVESELQLRPTPQSQQHQTQATSTTNTAACDNAGSLTQ